MSKGIEARKKNGSQEKRYDEPKTTLVNLSVCVYIYIYIYTHTRGLEL